MNHLAVSNVAMVPGADGVQIGSRFVVSEGSSAHPAFKAFILKLQQGDTQRALKKLIPVRLVKSAFFEQIDEAEKRGASTEELNQLLGKDRRFHF